MRIAIFNGFEFHYEMFGYIIYYCSVKNIELVIYTSNVNQFHYISFYETLFHDKIQFIVKDYQQFESEYRTFDYIFMTTDDDFKFKDEWIERNNIICIDHHYTIRRPIIDMRFHIATRPFFENQRKWALPCYPILNSNEKQKLLEEDTINIVTVGNNGDGYILQIINRLKSDKKIVLHAISRWVKDYFFYDIRSDIEVKRYENIDTFSLMDIIQKSDYAMCDIAFNYDHINGKSMSGGIPLAFSNVTPLIISSNNNQYYQFKTAIMFDLHSSDDIVLFKTGIDTFKNVENERDELIQMFHSHLAEMIE